ncbi:MAG: hypothetical protein AAGD32_01040 [Planctomycetota bacterium]
MSKNFNDWLAEGEDLYNTAVAELEELVQQRNEIDQRLSAKQDEVNQIAKVIGKPEVEGAEPDVEIVGGEGGVRRAPNSSNTIARALTGQGLAR